MSIVAEKKALRAQMRETITRIDREERAKRGCAIAEAVWAKAMAGSNASMIFYPLPDEPGIEEILNFLREGLVCLPRYLGDTDCYEAAVIKDRAADLESGKFGIPEPRAACKSLQLNQLDLVLVPGVAFSPDGARLGRGRGFYDRILDSVTGRKIGVAYDEQIVESVPAEAHDQRVTDIVTPTRWIRVS